MLFFWGGSQGVSAQDNSAISTKRDSPMGIVSFGAAVTSGVLGEGGFIDGYIKKAGSDAFIFPVGDNGAFRPFSVGSDQAIGAYYGVNPAVAVTSNPTGGDYGVLPAGGPFNTNNLGEGLAAVSTREYWDINGTSPTRITLSWNGNSAVNALLSNGALSKLTIVGWDGNKWVNLPASVDDTSLFGQASTASSGSLTTLLDIVPDVYNVYTLGALRDGALPVELVSFTGAARERASYLEWVTSEEVNSSHFEIERSDDAKSWRQIGSVDARGEGIATPATSVQYSFTDETPVGGNNFYRLKMVDRDETFAYSRIVNIAMDGQPDWAVYPNPVADKLFFSSYIKQNLASARLTDAVGRTMYASHGESGEGIDVSRMPPGLYLLKFSFTDGLSKSYKVLINR
ncbi:Por secretion system C-terminal sorting domain-containing protein [Dyadobacter sp. SG02]|uniref:T9SS type A sorting domain-containing protein n=1 Tax=Dyadobacter sp. SG02 TaxID=1855291 RepID=UPI0008C29402|nr:T9SS type A sorting domain-containing protein [Dyadobacter sp. SG02]SEJ53918.1 Por secretion system C-terminal sorting domain-containing protein [Dyadobacter sp. SG02]